MITKRKVYTNTESVYVKLGSTQLQIAHIYQWEDFPGDLFQGTDMRGFFKALEM